MTLAVIGGNYGSESKGVVVSGLAHQFDVAVRVGGPQAGHSFYYGDDLYKMRGVPCAWVNPDAVLMIGAGAVVDPELLESELASLPLPRKIYVDRQATIVQHAHAEYEKDTGLRQAIGSTNEGVGEARIAKIRRNGTAVLAKDYPWVETDLVVIADTQDMLTEARYNGREIMLEGTQGAGLSLHHGHYPFVTSNDTNAAQLAADAGLPPSAVEHTHLVIRTYPIRVNGNSGPTGGAELDWQQFIDNGAVTKPERTTVTKLERRIFEFSDDDFAKAISLNDPCGVWVAFADYVDPSIAGSTNLGAVLRGPMGDWMDQHIYPTGLPVLGIGTGGARWSIAQSESPMCWRWGHPDQEWVIVPPVPA